MIILIALGIILYFAIGLLAKADNEKMYQRFYKEAQDRRIQEREDLRRHGASKPIDQ